MGCETQQLGAEGTPSVVLQPLSMGTVGSRAAPDTEGCPGPACSQAHSNNFKAGNRFIPRQSFCFGSVYFKKEENQTRR